MELLYRSWHALWMPRSVADLVWARHSAASDLYETPHGCWDDEVRTDASSAERAVHDPVHHAKYSIRARKEGRDQVVEERVFYRRGWEVARVRIVERLLGDETASWDVLLEGEPSSWMARLTWPLVRRRLIEAHQHELEHRKHRMFEEALERLPRA